MDQSNGIDGGRIEDTRGVSCEASGSVMVGVGETVREAGAGGEGGGSVPIGMDRYVKGETLGEGTFGVVVKATDRVTGKQVALKKIRLQKLKEGVNVTALREIKLLKEVRSPHIVRLLDVFPHKRNLSLVFEFMESDLEAIIRSKGIFLTPADVKSYLRMTLEGVKVCHDNFVLHRDMKPNNLLIAADGTLKLADFGLARVHGSPDARMTTLVFARWYRAPELLFGAKKYGPGVDIWGVGCVFAELLLRRPLFAGNSDIDQLGKIFTVLGTPREENWPGMKMLPDYVEYAEILPAPLRTLFAGVPAAGTGPVLDDALDLLRRMLTYTPRERPTAAEALQHRYFSNEPRPTEPRKLPKPPVRNAAGGSGGGGGGNVAAAGVRREEDRLTSTAHTEAEAEMVVRAAPVAGCRRTSADMEIVESPIQHVATRASYPPRKHADAIGGAAIRARVLRQSCAGTDVAAMSCDRHDTPPTTDMVPMSTGDGGAMKMSTGGTVLGKRPYLNTEDRAYLRKRKQEMDDVINEESEALFDSSAQGEAVLFDAGVECPDL